MAAPLVVHEWGTFTSFQDADGRTIAGINVDDEPVPWFVHRLGAAEPFGTTQLPASWSQGAPRCHADVTMRLETPVLYFYPPTDWVPVAFDVQARFLGGWLTEFYPHATAERAGFPIVLDSQARGSLQWKQVRLDENSRVLMHATDWPVWQAPRQVGASVLFVPEEKEAEKYLFYRGVGHLDAPLVIRERHDGFDVALRGNDPLLASLPRLWLIEVLPDGRVRYQALDSGGRHGRATAFPAAPSGLASSLTSLRREMTEELVAQGLYADEAAAMLETWELSYFQSEGLRAFFILPQAWTDERLPLSISTPTRVTRAMVGRVELVSAHQRAQLARLQSLPEDSIPTVPLYVQDHGVIDRGLATKGPLSRLYERSGREVPESLRAYESLGRFRDALLAHEWKISSEGNRRARLGRVMQAYSACLSDLTPASLTTER
ncbi:MAG TPA: hypothetical protein VFZ95_05755 [Steroidobacteraceae bacterium]